MTLPLMPKATAVWLVENTALTFEQIAEFCGMHPLEVQGIADGEVSGGIRGLDPLANGQLTQDEITRCEADTKARLEIKATAKQYISQKTKGSRYTPVARRQDKPDAIAWLIKNYPGMTDAQICKLVGTTKNTINAVRGKTHWNSNNIKPRDPVLLGLCSQTHLDAAVAGIRTESVKLAELGEAKVK
ncbi:MAG: DUF1013 domain-containing protein [Proteobacteria bacterium]|nr:DUF1013 domain-containing protein [Pseudomonadota bacterium]